MSRVITNAKSDIPNYHKIPAELLQISFSKKAISDRTSKSVLQTRGNDAVENWKNVVLDLKFARTGVQWCVGVFDWMALGVSGITTKSASVVKKKNAT